MREVVFNVLLIVLLTTVLNSCLPLFPVKANGEHHVHNVNTDEYSDSIQEAIDDLDTVSGHTIQVEAEYNRTEDVVIDKSVYLDGEGRDLTLINGTSGGHVVYVSAPNVKISDFTVNGSSSYEDYSCICAGPNSQNLIVDNCRINNRNLGIYANDTSGVNVTNNIIMEARMLAFVPESVLK